MENDTANKIVRYLIICESNFIFFYANIIFCETFMPYLRTNKLVKIYKAKNENVENILVFFLGIL